MGRQPCCEKVGLKKGPWSLEEDRKLVNSITRNGHSCWREVPKLAGLLRCGKSCRLRWTNYLRPDLKRGLLSDAEEKLVIDLHAAIGNRWSRIAAQLPGRTDNEIKNYWNTRIKKTLKQMGIDPVTHKPLSELTASDCTNHNMKTHNKLLIKDNNSSSFNNSNSESSHHGTLPSSDTACTGEDASTTESQASKDTVALSKKERLELESREAHMKVQKMREAMLAFNSRFVNPSPTLMNSPSSVITLAHKMHYEDLDESLSVHRPRRSCRDDDDNVFSRQPIPKILGPNKLAPPLFPCGHVAAETSYHLAYTDNNNFSGLNYGANHTEQLCYGDELKPSSANTAYGFRHHCTELSEAKRSANPIILERFERSSAMEFSTFTPLHSTSATQEAMGSSWTKVSMGLQENILAQESLSTCSIASHASSQESSITSSALAFPTSASFDALSWNSMMQRFLGDGAMHSSFEDCQSATAASALTTSSTSGISSFSPFELQRLALLLEEI